MNNNGSFKVVVKNNHWEDGYKVKGTWKILSDSLILSCNLVGVKKQNNKKPFECEKTFFIDKEGLCLKINGKHICYIKR